MHALSRASSHVTRNKASYRGSNPSPDFFNDCLIAFLFSMHIDLVMANITFWYFFFLWILAWKNHHHHQRDWRSTCRHTIAHLHHRSNTPISIITWTHECFGCPSILQHESTRNYSKTEKKIINEIFNSEISISVVFFVCVCVSHQKCRWIFFWAVLQTFNLKLKLSAD